MQMATGECECMNMHFLLAWHNAHTYCQAMVTEIDFLTLKLCLLYLSLDSTRIAEDSSKTVLLQNSERRQSLPWWSSGKL